MAPAPDPGQLPPLRSQDRALAALARRGRLRELTPARGIDFTSNDYLGLANSPGLRAAAAEALSRGVPLGAGGSRLLRGNHPEFEALEAEAARFFGAESALYFGGGFQANAALVATLPAHGDLLVFDERIHASAWDGMAHTKAECRPARHNDAQSFADVIAAWREQGHTGRVHIALESLYSMDGDIAPFSSLSALADRFDAMLLIDEAHATGVLGPDGRGLAAAHGLEGRENVVTLHTCGKALGCSGALVTGPRAIRDLLINRARAFIYATAPSPLMAAVVRRALGILRDEPQRREQLGARVKTAHVALESSTGCTAPGTHIVPVIVGADADAVRLAGAMQARGYDIRAIRPPTVPVGSARLRIAITSGVDEPAIRAMMEALGEELAKLLKANSFGTPDRTRAPNSNVIPAKAGTHVGFNKRFGAAILRQLKRSTNLAQTPAETYVGPGLRRDDGLRDGLSHSKAPPRFVVTGTGTGVGKTVFAAALTLALDGDYWKPIQAGTLSQTDTERVRALTGLPADIFHPEAYRLATPASPHLAAARDGVTIDASTLTPPQTSRPLIIEGAGGLLVPLGDDTLLIDVFVRWQIPVILVAGTALGTINHTLLSIEALHARAVPIHGVAFVGEANESSEQAITSLGGIARLGRLDHLADLTAATLAAAFARGFNPADFAAPRRVTP